MVWSTRSKEEYKRVSYLVKWVNVVSAWMADRNTLQPMNMWSQPKVDNVSSDKLPISQYLHHSNSLMETHHLWNSFDFFPVFKIYLYIYCIPTDVLSVSVSAHTDSFFLMSVVSCGGVNSVLLLFYSYFCYFSQCWMIAAGDEKNNILLRQVAFAFLYSF